MDAYHLLPTYKDSLRNSRITRNPVFNLFQERMNILIQV